MEYKPQQLQEQDAEKDKKWLIVAEIYNRNIHIIIIHISVFLVKLMFNPLLC